MKRKDIIPSKLYIHVNHVGVVYIGTGRINDNNKDLVIIKASNPNDIGIVVTRPNTQGLRKFWAGFSPCNVTLKDLFN